MPKKGNCMQNNKKRNIKKCIKSRIVLLIHYRIQISENALLSQDVGQDFQIVIFIPIVFNKLKTVFQRFKIKLAQPINNYQF